MPPVAEPQNLHAFEAGPHAPSGLSGGAYLLGSYLPFALPNVPILEFGHGFDWTAHDVTDVLLKVDVAYV